MNKLKHFIAIAFVVILLAAVRAGAATPFPMVSGNYFEPFTNITSWANDFVSPTEATRWGSVAVNVTGTIPDGQRTTLATTTFSTSTTSGVQKSTGTNLVLLATGTTDNTNACAVDLYLDFTGRSPGTLSFDWLGITNSTGNRASSLRVYATTNGIGFTELTNVLDVSNNVAASGSITAVALPASFANSATARIRFYEYNGTGGSTGSRAKIGIDNVAVTSVASGPAPLVVLNNLDDGSVGSLRYVVSNSISGDTITFTNTLSGATILLTNGQIVLNQNVTITAAALTNGVQLNGNNASRIFQVNPGATVVLNSLTIANGAATHGGGVTNAGNLTVNNCTLTGNTATTGDGGGIHSIGTLTVNQSTLVGNKAARYGGGIELLNGTLTVNQTTISGNSCTNASGAGGIDRSSGSFVLNNSIVAKNSSPNFFSNIFGSFTATGNNLTNGNPQLGPLANNGGPTPTMLPLPGSPALNGCTNGTSFTYDQRGPGYPRVVDAFADIGAVEARVVTINPIANTTTSQNTPVIVAFTIGASNLTVTGSSSNQSLVPNANLVFGGSGTNRTLTLTPAPNALGSTTITVTVTDGLETNSTAFLFTVLQTRDAFGYTSTQPAYAFEDISSTGTRTLANNDERSANAALGFDFSFYGRVYSNLTFSPNGLITLGGTNTSQITNGNLTNAAPSGNLPSIAVLWDDWCTLTNDNVGVDALYFQTLGTPGDRRFVLQWNNIFGFPTSPSGVTFQAILYETNGNILCQYADVDSGNVRANGAQATVGIRDTDGHLNGKNRQWSFNQAVITNGEAILFSTIATDPSITAHPTSRTNAVGSTATFTVAATGTGPLGYQWQRSGTNISDGGNIFGTTTATLTLTNVVSSNAANYTVAVTNALGSKVVSAVASLTVGTLPTITTQPQSQTNVVGSDVTFTVAATGGVLAYQWQKNAVNIPGATDASYTAVNVQLADSGTLYTVVIANFLGAVTSAPPAILTVRVPVNLVVTSTSDSGAGSLRQASLDALSGDLITFAPGLSGSTITLISGQIVLAQSVAVDGSALAGGIQINGNNASRIFQVNPGATVVLNSLTITNGLAGDGGGVTNAGILTVNNCTFAGNTATNDGGGIHSIGTLTVNQSTLVGNTAARYGGGIERLNGALTVNQSTIVGNSCGNAGGAGGIDQFGASFVLNNSIVASNTSPYVDPNIFGSFTAIGNNLTNGDPQLGPLANNGGPTPTMLPLAGSPALNGCTNGTSFTYDQRGPGYPRVAGAFADIGAVEVSVISPSGPPLLTGLTQLGNGSFQFSFTNQAGAGFTVFASTNVSLPLASWSNLGAPLESPAGTFTFTDPQATNNVQRFYRVSSP